GPGPPETMPCTGTRDTRSPRSTWSRLRTWIRTPHRSTGATGGFWEHNRHRRKRLRPAGLGGPSYPAVLSLARIGDLKGRGAENGVGIDNWWAARRMQSRERSPESEWVGCSDDGLCVPLLSGIRSPESIDSYPHWWTLGSRKTPPRRVSPTDH